MYIVEGNMGVGKSTFCKEISRLAPDIETALEPLSVWAHHSGLQGECQSIMGRKCSVFQKDRFCCRRRESESNSAKNES